MCGLNKMRNKKLVAELISEKLREELDQKVSDTWNIFKQWYIIRGYKLDPEDKRFRARPCFS